MTRKPSPIGRGLGEGLGRRGTIAGALALATHPAQAQPCTRIADLPLTLVDGYPLVPATLAGRPVSLLLDTGAQGMLITPETAAALALPLAGMTRIYGTGGSTQARVVRLPGLRLGAAPMPDLLAPVAPLPIQLRSDPPLAGLLGAALLARFDLDIDIPAGRLTLHAPGTCAPPPGTTLPLEVTRAGEPFLPVRINGQPLLALLDTGTRATLLTQATARRLNLDAPASANTASGVDGERLPLGHVRVRFALGDEPPADTPVSIAPLQLERGDMLLGLDAIRTRRVWLAYGSGQVTFARPAGG